ncbi:MAG TPA: hypothetical protein VGP93_03555, partial [Polyangiaceae bacterium]|nr:hypothetical protein [Polyangiaceae bacterium]
MPDTRSPSVSGGNGNGLDSSSPDDEDYDDGDEIDPELEALLGLAQMDAEVAVAYAIVADYVGAGALQEKLLEFARTHERHVNEIGEFLLEQGVEPLDELPEPGSSAFATLANAMGGIGEKAAWAALH